MSSDKRESREEVAHREGVGETEESERTEELVRSGGNLSLGNGCASVFGKVWLTGNPC